MITIHIRAIETDFQNSFTEHYESIEVHADIVEVAVEMSLKQFHEDAKNAVALSIKYGANSMLVFKETCTLRNVQHDTRIGDQVREWMIKQVTE